MRSPPLDAERLTGGRGSDVLELYHPWEGPTSAARRGAAARVTPCVTSGSRPGDGLTRPARPRIRTDTVMSPRVKRAGKSRLGFRKSERPATAVARVGGTL